MSGLDARALLYDSLFVTLTWKRTLRKNTYIHILSDHLHQMVIDSSIAGLWGRHWGFQVFLSMSPTSPQGKIVPMKPSLQQP